MSFLFPAQCLSTAEVPEQMEAMVSTGFVQKYEEAVGEAQWKM